MAIYLPYIIGGAIALLLIILLAVGYVKAPPDMAYIISGAHKKPRILTGKAGVKIPFFERLDKLYLGAIQVDVKTSSSVPTAEYINIRVDSTVSVRVGRTPEAIALAAQNFLNVSREQISAKIVDLLEGNVREIIGQMHLTDMINDRKKFGDKVQQNAVPDLERYGLELITFNVQNFIDDNDVILNLGIDNIEQIRKAAAIAKSEAKKEIEIAEAANAKEANDAKVQAAEDIAERQNALDLKKAALKVKADTEVAKAEAAQDIEAERQRQIRDVAATNADIAKAERQAELKQKEIELKEYELDALVRKQADADKYAAEKEAEADLIRRQKDAEARAYEIEQEARAAKLKADADKYAAEQQAAGIAAVGKAEADAIEAKAEAQKKMGDASIVDLYLKALPQIVASASGPLENVKNITMYGNGNTEQLVGEVMRNANQIQNAVKDATGLDLAAMIEGFMTRKSQPKTNN